MPRRRVAASMLLSDVQSREAKATQPFQHKAAEIKRQTQIQNVRFEKQGAQGRRHEQLVGNLRNELFARAPAD